MSDELAAFFAKKANKGKKKGVIKLQEVADHLERRVKVQDEFDEAEAKSVEESANKFRSTSNDNNADSEWLEFEEKHDLPHVIKAMDDMDVEYDEEEKSSSVEQTKSWNINNENTEITPTPQPKEGKYMPKNLRNPLDITNEFAFPSLDKAEEVEKEQKKELEVKIRIELEAKRKQEEEMKKMENRYRAPRLQEFESPRRQAERKQEPDGPTEADDMANWRRADVKKEEEVSKSSSNQYTIDNKRNRHIEDSRKETETAAPNEADNAGTWRSEVKVKAREDVSSKYDANNENRRVWADKEAFPRHADGTNKADDTGNWREKKPSAKTEELPKVVQKTEETPKVGQKDAYVPPHLKRMMRADK